MLRLLPSPSLRRVAGLLYGRVVDAARAPYFYSDLQAPDTIEGRYELIVLHMSLVLRRLRDPDPARRKLAQALVDYMAADLDRSIRELGVGDLSVARFMKRLGEGLYGRAAAYDAALDAADGDALKAALLRNVYGAVRPEGRNLAVFAAYVAGQDASLGTGPRDRLLSGEVHFNDPSEYRAHVD